MLNHTKNPAESSPYLKLQLKLLEARFRTVKGSLEMLTVFERPNLKSALCMIEDAELLLESARELHAALSMMTGKQQPQNKPTQNADASQFVSDRLGHKQVLNALKEPDWIRLQQLKQTKAYKGLNIIIDGKPFTIRTFAQYCLYVEDRSYRSVTEDLAHLKKLGEKLFLALRQTGIGVREMRTCCKLSDEQKQALLQIAQTGDKAATLAFIQQALPAGE